MKPKRNPGLRGSQAEARNGISCLLGNQKDNRSFAFPQAYRTAVIRRRYHLTPVIARLVADVLFQDRAQWR